jgi:hypothetical protein
MEIAKPVAIECAAFEVEFLSFCIAEYFRSHSTAMIAPAKLC